MANDMTPLDANGVFSFTSFLEGSSRAYGIFEDRFGTIRRSFTVDLIGRWRDNVFVLDEQFYFCDGERDQRQWQIVPNPDGSLSARAGDVVGSASGKASRDGLQLAYRMRMPVNGRTVDLDFEDRFHLVSSDRLVSRATVKKWGIRVGEVTLFMERAKAVTLQAAA